MIIGLQKWLRQTLPPRLTEYELVRSDRKTLGMQLKNGKLYIRVPRRASDAEIKGFVLAHKGWLGRNLDKQLAEKQRRDDVRKLTQAEIDILVEKALQIIPLRVKFYAPRVGVDYGRITIRAQRTRWGSCSANGNLSFNFLLMLAPMEVLDSVVVHELCHRIVMNHSKKFYDEVLRVFPDYKIHNKWLKDNGGRLLAMLDR